MNTFIIQTKFDHRN